MDKQNPYIHHRKSIRLKRYNYSQAGLYFITICCQNRACLFGEIDDGEMVLNDAGKMIENIWNKIPNIHSGIGIKEFAIMPNHIHGIIEIIKPVGADSISVQNNGQNRADMESAPTMTPTIPMVVQSFKRYSTVQYIKMVKNGILPPFDKRIWQRNYWEHIIRNENEYFHITQYIIDNPKKWDMDKLNDADGNRVMEAQALYNYEAWMV